MKRGKFILICASAGSPDVARAYIPRSTPCISAVIATQIYLFLSVLFIFRYFGYVYLNPAFMGLGRVRVERVATPCFSSTLWSVIGRGNLLRSRIG